MKASLALNLMPVVLARIIRINIYRNNSRLAETVMDMSHPPPTMAHNVQFQDNMNSRSIVRYLMILPKVYGIKTFIYVRC